MRRRTRTSDNELLGAASHGDAEAFGVFYDRHAVTLIGSLRHRTGSPDLALDLAAEVFATALERCGDFEARDEQSARGWLYAIARNKLVDFYRRGSAEDGARRRLGIQTVPLSDSELDLLEQQLDAAKRGVLAALEDLPEDEREAVRARVLDEAEYGALAERLDVSQSVVRQRVSRGLRRLRLSMKEPS
jgi:RNA polymerase sigma factor (sigma-70 family)